MTASLHVLKDLCKGLELADDDCIIVFDVLPNRRWMCWSVSNKF